MLNSAMFNKPQNQQKNNHVPVFSMSLISLSIFSFHISAFAESLEQINVVDESPVNSTSGSKGYSIKSMNTATGLHISGKNTPQSVSVITRKQLDDRAIHSLEEAMRNATGINVVRDSGLQTRFLSRGFYVDQIAEDNITTNVGGRSGYTAKIDVIPSTDLAVYDHIEVVRGATGLTQSNSEPGGTINLIRKRPTEKFQHLGELTTDQRGSIRTMLDISGPMNTEKSVRGRLVGVDEKTNSFKDNVKSRKKLIYGVLETNIHDKGLFTLGGMYQKIDEVPDFAGVILPCKDPKIAPFSSRPACNHPIVLPRNTYLGESWSRLKGDKYNLFSETKFFLDNNWEFSIEASYTQNNSDAKIGQYFIKDEHAAGLSGEDATGFLTEKGEVIPFEPKDKALEKLKSYRDEAQAEYKKQKLEYIQHHLDEKDFTSYRNMRIESRKQGFKQCMSDVGLDFLCSDWLDPGIEQDKNDYVDKKLQESGISNDANSRFANWMYGSALNSKGTTNRKFSLTPIHYRKKDEQYAIKLNLSGNYQLLDRTHDFYMSYGFNNESIESDYVEIFQTPYRAKPKSEAEGVHAHLAGICEPDPNGREKSPFTKNTPEPNWGLYDEKGNHKVYMSGCKDSKKDKLVLRHNADGTVARDPETHEPIYDPVDEVDEHGNKIVIGTTEYGRRKLYKHVQEPDNMQLANYNYSKYLNKNRTHSIVMSSRFNVTDKWHLLTGLQFTHFSTLQSKDMLVYDGKPASTFQTQSSLAQDHEHYTARAKGHKFTPYFGITYDLTDNQSLYASYTKIFKQQDNVDVTSKTALPPLMGTNTEIGWKGSFFEERLNSSIAFFHIEQKNRTVVDFAYIPGKSGKLGSFETIAKPIGRVVSKGFEIETAGNLTENWQIFLGYTYNKSKYKNAQEINAERLAKNSKANPYNFSNFTPIQMFRLATSYRIPNSKWTIGGGISAQSSTSSLYNIEQAGYTLWDANIQYSLGANANLSLIGINLTDKTYFENNYNRTRGMNNFYGRPRTVMMKFDWHF
mgnify:FL=1